MRERGNKTLKKICRTREIFGFEIIIADKETVVHGSFLVFRFNSRIVIKY
jgi:hypothetical protein